MNPDAPLTNAVEMRTHHEPADEFLRRHQPPHSNQLAIATRTGGIDLFWLPLGAGGRSVRFNGIVFEALSAKLDRRARSDLYHSALDVRLPETRYVIEMTPIRALDAPGREAVAGGAVGSPMLGRSRLFRYEIIRWRDGVIPDVVEAVGSPQHLCEDRETARRLLEFVPLVPTPVWGRDELQAGEMWNSNSVIAWLLASSGLDAESIAPPEHGRAPGWHAGLTVARRHAQDVTALPVRPNRERLAREPERGRPTSRRSCQPGSAGGRAADSGPRLSP